MNLAQCLRNNDGYKITNIFFKFSAHFSTRMVKLIVARSPKVAAVNSRMQSPTHALSVAVKAWISNYIPHKTMEVNYLSIL